MRRRLLLLAATLPIIALGTFLGVRLWEQSQRHAEERYLEGPADPRVREVLLSDPAIQAMVGTGAEGVDYWLEIEPIIHGAFGDEGAYVVMVFAQPIDYKGPVRTSPQPCKGRYPDGGPSIDPSEPCLDKPRKFYMSEVHIANSRLLELQVDTIKDLVFNLFNNYYSYGDAGADRIISRLEAQTPEQSH